MMSSTLPILTSYLAVILLAFIITLPSITTMTTVSASVTLFVAPKPKRMMNKPSSSTTNSRSSRSSSSSSSTKTATNNKNNNPFTNYQYYFDESIKNKNSIKQQLPPFPEWAKPSDFGFQTLEQLENVLLGSSSLSSSSVTTITTRPSWFEKEFAKFVNKSEAKSSILFHHHRNNRATTTKQQQQQPSDESSSISSPPWFTTTTMIDSDETSSSSCSATKPCSSLQHALSIAPPHATIALLPGLHDDICDIKITTPIKLEGRTDFMKEYEKFLAFSNNINQNKHKQDFLLPTSVVFQCNSNSASVSSSPILTFENVLANVENIHFTRPSTSSSKSSSCVYVVRSSQEHYTESNRFFKCTFEKCFAEKLIDEDEADENNNKNILLGGAVTILYKHSLGGRTFEISRSAFHENIASIQLTNFLDNTTSIHAAGAVVASSFHGNNNNNQDSDDTDENESIVTTSNNVVDRFANQSIANSSHYNNLDDFDDDKSDLENFCDAYILDGPFERNVALNQIPLEGIFWRHRVVRDVDNVEKINTKNNNNQQSSKDDDENNNNNNNNNDRHAAAKYAYSTIVPYRYRRHFKNVKARVQTRDPHPLKQQQQFNNNNNNNKNSPKIDPQLSMIWCEENRNWAIAEMLLPDAAENFNKNPNFMFFLHNAELLSASKNESIRQDEKMHPCRCLNNPCSATSSSGSSSRSRNSVLSSSSSSNHYYYSPNQLPPHFFSAWSHTSPFVKDVFITPRCISRAYLTSFIEKEEESQNSEDDNNNLEENTNNNDSVNSDHHNECDTFILNGIPQAQDQRLRIFTRSKNPRLRQRFGRPVFISAEYEQQEDPEKPFDQLKNTKNNNKKGNNNKKRSARSDDDDSNSNIVPPQYLWYCGPQDEWVLGAENGTLLSLVPSDDQVTKAMNRLLAEEAKTASVEHNIYAEKTAFDLSQDELWQLAYLEEQQKLENAMSVGCERGIASSQTNALHPLQIAVGSWQYWGVNEWKAPEIPSRQISITCLPSFVSSRKKSSNKNNNKKSSSSSSSSSPSSNNNFYCNMIQLYHALPMIGGGSSPNLPPSSPSKETETTTNNNGDGIIRKQQQQQQQSATFFSSSATTAGPFTLIPDFQWAGRPVYEHVYHHHHLHHQHSSSSSSQQQLNNNKFFVWYCMSLAEWIVVDTDPRLLDPSVGDQDRCFRAISSSTTFALSPVQGMLKWAMFLGENYHENEWVAAAEGTGFKCVDKCSNFALWFRDLQFMNNNNHNATSMLSLALIEGKYEVFGEPNQKIFTTSSSSSSNSVVLFYDEKAVRRDAENYLGAWIFAEKVPVTLPNGEKTTQLVRKFLGLRSSLVNTNHQQQQSKQTQETHKNNDKKKSPRRKLRSMSNRGDKHNNNKKENENNNNNKASSTSSHKNYDETLLRLHPFYITQFHPINSESNVVQITPLSSRPSWQCVSEMNSCRSVSVQVEQKKKKKSNNHQQSDDGSNSRDTKSTIIDSVEGNYSESFLHAGRPVYIQNLKPDTNDDKPQKPKNENNNQEDNTESSKNINDQKYERQIGGRKKRRLARKQKQQTEDDDTTKPSDTKSTSVDDVSNINEPSVIYFSESNFKWVIANYSSFIIHRQQMMNKKHRNTSTTSPAGVFLSSARSLSVSPTTDVAWEQLLVMTSSSSSPTNNNNNNDRKQPSAPSSSSRLNVIVRCTDPIKDSSIQPFDPFGRPRSKDVSDNFTLCTFIDNQVSLRISGGDDDEDEDVNRRKISSVSVAGGIAITSIFGGRGGSSPSTYSSSSAGIGDERFIGIRKSNFTRNEATLLSTITDDDDADDAHTLTFLLEEEKSRLMDETSIPKPDSHHPLTQQNILIEEANRRVHDDDDNEVSSLSNLHQHRIINDDSDQMLAGALLVISHHHQNHRNHNNNDDKYGQNSEFIHRQNLYRTLQFAMLDTIVAENSAHGSTTIIKMSSSDENDRRETDDTNGNVNENPTTTKKTPHQQQTPHHHRFPSSRAAGGLAFINLFSAYIKGSSLLSNDAISGSGGAIRAHRVTNITLHLTHCGQNFAAHSGGCIFVSDQDATTKSINIFGHSELFLNRAGGAGGGIGSGSGSGGGSHLVVSASGLGTAIFAPTSSLTIVNSRLDRSIGENVITSLAMSFTTTSSATRNNNNNNNNQGFGEFNCVQQYQQPQQQQKPNTKNSNNNNNNNDVLNLKFTSFAGSVVGGYGCLNVDAYHDQLQQLLSSEEYNNNNHHYHREEEDQTGGNMARLSEFMEHRIAFLNNASSLLSLSSSYFDLLQAEKKNRLLSSSSKSRENNDNNNNNRAKDTLNNINNNEEQRKSVSSSSSVVPESDNDNNNIPKKYRMMPRVWWLPFDFLYQPIFDNDHDFNRFGGGAIIIHDNGNDYRFLAEIANTVTTLAQFWIFGTIVVYAYFHFYVLKYAAVVVDEE